MNNKIDGKTRSGSTKAMLLVSCLLICAMSPVIMSFDEDSDASATLTPLNYVSIGDSMVNGCGMENYYTDNGDVSKNYYGFEVVTENQSGKHQTYPGMLTDYLVSKNYDVTLNQLAISGLRSGEIRTLLDPGFIGDYYTRGELDGSVDDHILTAMERLPGFGYEGSVDGLREYYADKISEADLISYQSHWDFGNEIGKTIMGLLSGNDYYPPEFDVYIDESILETIECVRAELTYAIEDILSSQGISLEGYEGKIHAIESLTNVAIYTVVSYCSNFDAIMGSIFTMNPDAKVIVLDSYSIIDGLKIIAGDITIPLDDMFQILLDVSNLYTKYLSPYSRMTYHIDIDEPVDRLSDDFIKFDVNNIEETEISEDTKYLLMSRILKTSVNYDAITTDDRVETLFFQKVFNTREIDLGTLGNMDFGNLTAKVTNTMYTFGKWSLYGSYVECTLKDDGNGGCIIRANYLNPSTQDEEVTFSQAELGLLQIYFSAYCEGAAIAHPSASGHQTILNALVEVIDDVLMEESVCNDRIPLGSPATTAGTYGTMVDLTDMVGSLGSNPQFIADSLGLEIDPVALPADARIDDILYLLGGTDVSDAYCEELLTTLVADLGCSVDDIRSMYQDAVIKSSAVLVSAGSNNILSVVERCIDIYNGNTVDALDFSVFDNIDAGLLSTISDIRSAMDDILTSILGEDSAIVDTIDDINAMLDSAVYGVLGYTDNYAKVVDAIKTLNPDTEIIVVGPYNMLDGFVYTIPDTGLTVDIGAIAGIVFDGINSFNASQVGGIDGVTYIDMRDAHNNDNVIDIGNIDGSGSVMSSILLSGDEILAFTTDVVEVFSANTYTVTFDVDGVVDVQTYVFGQDIVIPADPEKEGFTFTGWDGTVPDTMPASNLYFTAQWEAIPTPGPGPSPEPGPGPEEEDDDKDKGGLGTIHYAAIGAAAVILVLVALIYLRRH